MNSVSIVNAIPSDVFEAVCHAYATAQQHSVNHRKHVHALLTLFKEQSGAVGEQSFFLANLHCLHHILSIRKNDELSSRLMRFFVGLMVRISTLKTGASCRFIENFLLYALESCDAKDKWVRARLCQVVVAGLNGVGDEVSGQVWEAVKSKFKPRLMDKEAMVRVYAVHALARLQALVDDDGQSVMDLFMHLLQFDPQAQVRKAVLTQIDVNSQSLPIILTRTRDIDPQIRRTFYAKKMVEIDVLSLSVEERDLVLKAGLSDRDESVQKACVDMIFSHWLPRTSSNLVEFLTCIDVVSNTKVAEDALKAFFAVIPGLFQSFPDSYFDHLTVETVFIFRVYYSLNTDLPIPELSTLANVIHRFYQYLVALADDEVAKLECEFIVIELIKVCMLQDTSDEVGRRACLGVMQDVVVNLSISEDLFAAAMDLSLRLASSLDDHLAAMVSLSGDFASLGQHGSDEHTSILAQFKSVSVVSELLRHLTTIANYPMLLQLLNELVIPAINSPYALVQSSGLQCLGLFMLNSRDLADEYKTLFIDFFKSNTGQSAKCQALQVLFDLMLVSACSADAQEISSVCTSALYDPDMQVQAIAAEGFAKLLLHDKLANTHQVIHGLLMLHFHPGTRDNQRLRQCLSFFLHAYCFGSHQHQSCVLRVFAECLVSCATLPNVSLNTVFTQLMYLTDSQMAGNQENDYLVVIEDMMWAALCNKSVKMMQLACKPPVSPSNQAAIKRLSWLVSVSLKANLPFSADRSCLSGLRRLAHSLCEVDDGSAVMDAGLAKEWRGRIDRLYPNWSSQPIAAKGRRRTATMNDVENIMDNIQDILE